MNDYRKEYAIWCESDVFDEETKRELGGLSEEEIKDRFSRTLSFGTGGLRGILGAGTDRMNRYTVGKATQGLADYLNEKAKGGSVVLAYDSRNRSAEFARDAALILAANGIRAYLFESLRPTPVLSFAVRFLGASAGIVITASHNPPQYNGYKVYRADGGQIVPPEDKEIVARIDAVPGYGAVRRADPERAERDGLLVSVGKEIDDAYLAAIEALVLEPEAIAAEGKKLKIVYTPLHGTGNVLVRRVLRELGFENVWVVPEQEAPDGNFPTVKSPNPEDGRAFELALRLAKKVDADLVLATDPDADRLGVYAKDRAGEYRPFTGNMSGLLLAEYELSRRKARGMLPDDPRDGALVTTIVSSRMARALAKEYGLSSIETLTGFKYVGEQIERFEEAKEKNGGKLDRRKGAYRFEFGFEESYGCLIGTYARDKDAVSAAMAICEAAAYYAREGLTLCDAMERLYEKYGYHREALECFEAPGEDGAKKIAAVMEALRARPPKTLGGEAVVSATDYLTGIETRRGVQKKTTLPASDVLCFETEGGSWCCVRPSGTEPKMKLYFGVAGRSRADAEKKLAALKKGLADDRKGMDGWLS